MSNNIKRLIDEDGNSFAPQTSLNAITATAISGGNFIVTNDAGTGVEVSDATIQDILLGKANIHRVTNITEIPDATLNTISLGDIVCCSTLNNAFFVTRYDVISSTLKTIEMCCPAEDKNCDAAYITYRWEQGSNDNQWYTNGLFRFTNYIRLLQGTVDNQTHNSTLMDSNAVYRYGTLSGDVTFRIERSNAININEMNIWCWTFDTELIPPSITWPTGLSWNKNNNTEVVSDVVLPIVESSKHYEVTIMDNYATIISADVIQPNNGE